MSRESGTRAVTLEGLRVELQSERARLAALDARVDGARLLEDVLARLDNLAWTPPAPVDPLLTLRAAAEDSGFSADYLGILVRRGDLKNYGRPGAPRVRQSEVPRKRAALAPTDGAQRSSRGNGRASLGPKGRGNIR